MLVILFAIFLIVLWSVIISESSKSSNMRNKPCDIYWRVDGYKGGFILNNRRNNGGKSRTI